MLRIFVLVLLLANGLYYAWSQGALAGLGLAPAEQHEPERLKAQIEPQALRLLNGAREDTTGGVPRSGAAAAAPVASAPAQTCWQAAGFSVAQADALRVSLARAGLAPDQWQLSEARSAGRWVVYMGRYNDEQMQKKKAELRELKIEFREVNLPSAGPGLALGTFSSEEAVQQALRDMAKKGVRSARAAVERPEIVSMTLRLPAVTDEQRAKVEGLGDTLAGKKLQPCE